MTALPSFAACQRQRQRDPRLAVEPPFPYFQGIWAWMARQEEEEEEEEEHKVQCVSIRLVSYRQSQRQKEANIVQQVRTHPSCG